ncbi:MAG: hypothetical protein JSU92_10350 [Deltaproteobacteria bacterium]|nr:MAG: hypothetical protein JSU92_10350 [Deltaproteobacteria bacterium]
MKKIRSKWQFLLLLFLCLLLSYDCGEEKSDTETNGKGSLEMREGIYVLHLKGTPYEMGYQHGSLMRDGIAAVTDFIDTTFGPYIEYISEATPYIEKWLPESLKEEIQGIVDGSGGAISYEMLVMFSCPIHLLNIIPIMCSSFAAANEATSDGELVHGRNMDWLFMEFAVEYPTVVIYEPEGDIIPFCSIGYPGIVGVLTGMNLEGITASIHWSDSTDENWDGKPIYPQLREIMENARSLTEAEAILTGTKRGCGANIILTDGEAKEGSVVEISANNYAVRGPVSSLVWVTNHYVSEEMKPLQDGDPSESSLNRYSRMGSLLEEHYGQIDVEKAIEIMRDHFDIDSQEYVPPETSSKTIANEETMHSIIFKPSIFNFWVAMGEMPAAMNKFVGFNLMEEIDPSYQPEEEPTDFPPAATEKP